jgi:hypothetical protein
MRHKCYVVTTALFALSLLAVPALAHHAFQAEYDEHKIITLKGVLTKVDWINPHIYFYLDLVDVKDASGNPQHWKLGTTAPGAYRNAGLTRAMWKVGDTYTVTAAAAKDGTNLAHVIDWVFPDGHKVKVWFGDVNDAK